MFATDRIAQGSQQMAKCQHESKIGTAKPNMHTNRLLHPQGTATQQAKTANHLEKGQNVIMEGRDQYADDDPWLGMPCCTGGPNALQQRNPGAR